MRAYSSETELTELIYACVLGEAPWISFLERLDTVLPGAKTHLVAADSRNSSVNFNFSTNITQETLDNYNDYYAGINPWIPMVRHHPVGRGTISDDILPRRETMKTEYYNDFMRPLEARSALGVVVVKDPQKSFILSMFTSSDEPERIRPVADLMSRLSPHLGRAFRFYQQDAASRFLGESAGLLSTATVGIVLVRENRMIRFVNGEAEKMIAQRCGITFSPTGRLVFSDSGSAEKLDFLLRRDLLPHTVLTSSPEGQEGPYRYTFVRITSDGISDFLNGPSVVILIEKKREDSRMRLDALSAACGLTPAEARVAAGIAEGKTVNELAAANSVSRETVRSQLKHVYAKLGVNRQAELVRLIG
ncbi:MAG: helix-turn-helix transcriptional regulator [Shinella sp.]|nr:helix-turn-helix transcriptional regulator [Shinella sp.]